jgi:hypothetical protein
MTCLTKLNQANDAGNLWVVPPGPDSRKTPHWVGIWTWGGTRIYAECSASGARLSKTECRLTRARQTCWRSSSDECWVPRRRRGSASWVVTAYQACQPSLMPAVRLDQELGIATPAREEGG